MTQHDKKEREKERKRERESTPWEGTEEIVNNMHVGTSSYNWKEI